MGQEIEMCMSKVLEVTGAMVKLLSDKATELDSERERCIERRSEMYKKKSENNCDYSVLRDYMSKWDELTITDRMTVVDSLIEKIRISEAEMTIEWKI